MTTTPRAMTLLFADISGSTHLFERLGDTEAGHAIERCLKRMTRSVEAYKGRTIQIAGDELFAAFDSCEDACQAAVDMQERTADLPPVSGLKLSIRIGLHTGPVSAAGDTLVGDAVTSAARIAGLAAPDQILASSALRDALPAHTQVLMPPYAERGQIDEGGNALALYQVHWAKRDESAAEKSEDRAPQAAAQSGRLCVRYRGKAFLVDDKTPLLSLGRDPHNKLVIVDRKASRKHGKIERRGEEYFYTDSSTNGSFVHFAGQHEIMVRGDQLQLHGSGRICFGSSGNDPKSDFIDFEPL